MSCTDHNCVSMLLKTRYTKILVKLPSYAKLMLRKNTRLICKFGKIIFYVFHPSIEIVYFPLIFIDSHFWKFCLRENKSRHH